MWRLGLCYKGHNLEGSKWCNVEAMDTGRGKQETLDKQFLVDVHWGITISAGLVSGHL